MAGDDLVIRHQAALLQHGFQRGEPDLVTAHRQIFASRPVLAREARHVEVPPARYGHGEREREGAAFPVGVEHRLVRLRLDPPEAVHAADVLRAVHVESARRFGKPVPIIELRVTNAPSLSAPAVGAGGPHGDDR